MNLFGFIDVDAEHMPQFMDLNALAHETVFTALLAGGAVVQHYPLWSDAPSPDWLDVHFQEHLSWSVELSLALPPDLSVLDMENEQAVRAWLANHYLHHLVVSQVMGI